MLYCIVETSAQVNKTNSFLVNKLQTFYSTYAPEKAYLQFDKPYYAAGDTIYFKAYVTASEQHQLSEVSGVLHVDLINAENSINQSIKLRLDSGVCWGDFALPDSLPAGNYRVRAYTQWMRNLDEINFFNRSISIGSSIKNHATSNIANQSRQALKNKPDIQFFPEGGSIITGIPTKVAFKAIGTNGLGIDVKGTIVDNKNEEICQFASTHLGMGYFFLDPADSNTYRARVTFSDGTQSIFDLPKPETYGISLSVNNDSISTISFIIRASQSYYQANQEKNFLLFIYSSGNVIPYTFKEDATTITLDIKRSLLGTGVATVTLFSDEGEPLCERLLFMQNPPMLNLSIRVDKPVHKKRKDCIAIECKRHFGLTCHRSFFNIRN